MNTTKHCPPLMTGEASRLILELIYVYDTPPQMLRHAQRLCRAATAFKREADLFLANPSIKRATGEQ